MKKLTFLLVAAVLLLTTCNQSKKIKVSNDSRFMSYITGFTTGVISKKDNLIIQFSDLVTLPEAPSLDLLNISPSISGSLIRSGQSLVFKPETTLSSGDKYAVKVNLAQLVQDVPEELKEFVFSFETIAQDYELELDGLRTTDNSNPKVLELTGTLSTADHIENEEAEKMLSVSGQKIEWNHMSSTSHLFSIKGIERTDDAYEIELNASGNAIGVSKSAEQRYEIPSVKDFSISSMSVNKTTNGYVSLLFTDPLQTNQNLDGLIRIDGEASPKFVIDGNEVQVYLTRMLSGSKHIVIDEGVKNVFGHPLKAPIDRYLAFDPEDPQIQLIGKGTILPSTDGLVLPFESVNLKTVRVDVVQVFEQNIPQFLQANNLDGQDQIKRTGRKVMKKSVDLSEYSKDLSNWNRFTLDLTSLFETEKGAIYQVRLSFRPEDSVYPCGDLLESAESYNELDISSWSIFDNDGFDYWGDYSSYYYPPGYRWDERDNPCHVSYYNRQRFVTRNLVASDIGLIAKIGGDNSLNVFTTNMVSASPLSANVKVLDYQLQTMGEGLTNADGFASFNPERRPFLVIAESNGQKSYLKLDDGTALSMSNFDVSGDRIRNGIKGFIYGERGVWRPGNDIYLSFMLEDTDDRIPTDQPVIFELRDPMGNIKDRQVATSSVENIYAFKTQTDPTDVTGNWNATVKVGNASFSKRVKVETIKPNRLKIDLDFGTEKIAYANRNINPTMTVNWLTGIKGSNLKAETELSFQGINTTFEGYGNYEFDSPFKAVSTDQKVIFTGNTDVNGAVKFNYLLPEQEDAGGALRAIFETKAFEPGGDFSISSRSLSYYPYESFVGLQLPDGDEWGRLKRGVDHRVNIALVDSEGKPATGSVRMKIYKVNWRWWWDESEDYSINYVRGSNRDLISSKNVQIQNGKGSATFTADRWGRYLMVMEDLNSGHISGDYFYMGWNADEQGQLGATFMTISTDKVEYEVGDEIELTIPGSKDAQALVSIENGSKVLTNFWTKTEDGSHTVKVEVTPEMAPNIYAHVTLLQPHAQTGNDLPIRLYGIAPLKVVDKATILEPEIAMVDELEPGKKVTITVSEKNDKPMAYTLAIVDEGLLDITNFKTPDAWNHFYSREAIGVKTWDIYNEVIGAYGGRLERLMAIGGDGEANADDKNKKKLDERFTPVVQFMGPFFSNGSDQTHTFTMPQYIGSVKTMVVAGMDGAYGKADKATPVIKPLMVLGTLPRVTGPGEKIKLPVNVFRYKNNIKNATITIETEGLISIDGEKSGKVDLSSSANKVTYFDLQVAKAIGIGKVKITAKSGSETATHEILLESRAPNTPQTQVKMMTIDKGKSFNGELTTFGMDGTNTAVLEISKVPSMNLEKRLQYLIRYPHGCIEQTTSSVFPQLFLADIISLTSEQQVKIEENIKKGIERLKKFQTTEGGFAYWPGDSDPSSWGSNYGYHFLIEAEKKGYYVPKEMIKNLKKYQQRKAKNWDKSSDRYNDDLTQAYRLFTLAITGNAELSSMNRMMNRTDLSQEALWRLAATYGVIGKNSVAKEIMVKPSDAHSKYDYIHSYGSAERDQAMLLETYTYMGDKEKGFKVLRALSKSLSEDRWFSTQTTAYSLLAITKYLGGNVTGTNVAAEVNYAGASDNWESELPILRSSLDANSSDKKLSITNKGDGTLFITITTTGTPYPGDEPASKSSIGMNVSYYNQRGEAISLNDIKQGQTFEATIKITNEYPGRINDVALSQVFPSGWEINNDRLNDTNSYNNSTFDYQDIRDDRIYTYFDLSRGESKVFKVRLTATYAGEYYFPGAYCEAMYDASLNAKDKGQWITVQ